MFISEFSFNFREDGSLEIVSEFCPQFTNQAAKLCKDFKALNPEGVAAELDINVEKATARVHVVIPIKRSGEGQVAAEEPVAAPAPESSFKLKQEPLSVPDYEKKHGTHPAPKPPARKK